MRLDLSDLPQEQPESQTVMPEGLSKRGWKVGERTEAHLGGCDYYPLSHAVLALLLQLFAQDIGG